MAINLNESCDLSNNVFKLMVMDEKSGDAKTYTLFMKDQKNVIDTLESDPENVTESLEKLLNMKLVPEESNTIPERWGVCYDYIWALTAETWFLIEKLYSPYISLTGKFTLYPGIKMASFLQNEKVCKILEDYLRSTSITRYYSILPSHSYHIMINNILTKYYTNNYEDVLEKIGNGVLAWNTERWQDSDKKSLECQLKEIYFRETLGIHCEFLPESQFFVQNSRDLLFTKFRVSSDNVPYYLTLGYKNTPEMPPPSLMEEIGRNLTKILTESVECELPLFYKYESVDDYELISKNN